MVHWSQIRVLLEFRRMLDILQSYLIRKTRCLIASYDTFNTLSRNARCCRQMNAEVAQMTWPSRVKPQQRLVVPTHSRTQKRKNWITLAFYDETTSNLSFVPETRWAPPPVRPHSQIHRLPWPALSFSPPHSNSTSCLCVRVSSPDAAGHPVFKPDGRFMWSLQERRTAQILAITSETVRKCLKRDRTIYCIRENESRRTRLQPNGLGHPFINRFHDSHFWLLELPLSRLVCNFFEAHALNCRSEKSLKLSPTNRKHTRLKHAEQRSKPWF